MKTLENTLIGVILNPKARKVKRNPEKFLKRFKDIVSTHGEVCITSNYEELRQCLINYKEKNFGVIGITGGDGSLHYVITVLKNEFPDYNPAILLLKGGTMDNVGRSKRIRGTDTMILNRYIRKISREQPVTVVEQSMLYVDGKYSFIFGIGFITRFLRKAYEKHKGYFQNMIAGVDTLLDVFRKKANRKYFIKVKGTFIVDGTVLPFKKTHGILGATVSSIAHGFDSLYRAKGKEDAFHVIITGRSTKWIISHVLFLVSGIELHTKKHFDGVINTLEIIADKPFEYTLDGDIYTCKKKLLIEKKGSIKLVIV